MPRAKIHNRINITFLAVIIAVIFFVPAVNEYTFSHFDYYMLAAFFAGFLFSNYFLSPDLDLKSSACLRRWGRLKILWRPYSWMFDHRKLSHSILLGTLTRILYLAALVFIILYILDLSSVFRFDWRIFLTQKYWAAAILAGLYLPGILHTIIDRTL